MPSQQPSVLPSYFWIQRKCEANSFSKLDLGNIKENSAEILIHEAVVFIVNHHLQNILRREAKLVIVRDRTQEGEMEEEAGGEHTHPSPDAAEEEGGSLDLQQGFEESEEGHSAEIDKQRSWNMLEEEGGIATGQPADPLSLESISDPLSPRTRCSLRV